MPDYTITYETILFTQGQARTRKAKGLKITETRIVRRGIDWVQTTPWLAVNVEESN